MTSFRRVAFSLGAVAICGGALLFSLSTANGQTSISNTATGSSPSGLTSAGSPSGGIGATSAAGAGAAPAGVATTTGSPVFKQTIGASPVQIGKKNFIVLGGLGTEDSYDLQTENLYSLLRQRGTPIPNVLHPLSTAKPSFIVERLIVLTLTAATSANSAGGASSASSSSSSGRGSSSLGSSDAGAGAGAQTPQGPTEAEKTVTAVRRVVDAEIARGTGRLGGAHRQKLLLLRNAIRSLEQANQIGAVVNQAIGAAQGAAGASAGGNDKSDVDLREFLYGRARLTSRAADRYTPNIP